MSEKFVASGAAVLLTLGTHMVELLKLEKLTSKHPSYAEQKAQLRNDICRSRQNVADFYVENPKAFLLRRYCMRKRESKHLDLRVAMVFSMLASCHLIHGIHEICITDVARTCAEADEFHPHQVLEFRRLISLMALEEILVVLDQPSGIPLPNILLSHQAWDAICGGALCIGLLTNDALKQIRFLQSERTSLRAKKQTEKTVAALKKSKKSNGGGIIDFPVRRRT